MPLYEYACEACGDDFERIVRLSEADRPQVCPTCGEKGKPVDLLTVKAMLARPLSVLEGRRYLFCRTADCPVVYYAEDADQTFGEADLRERVFQKHPEDPSVFVCYCFQHRVDAVRREGAAVAGRIQAGIRAGQCACEVRNPQGSCCLGNVHRVARAG